MGHVHATVRIFGPGRRRVHECSLLVDTGSTYTWVAAETLKKLGVKPVKRIPIETIEGRIIKRRIGEAQIECAGESATRIVVFASGTDGQVLGIDALEGLRLEIDPLKRRLKKTKAVLAM